MTAHYVSTGKGKAFEHPCDDCGAARAPFGYNVNLRNAIQYKNADHAGKWYCKLYKDKYERS